MSTVVTTPDLWYTRCPVPTASCVAITSGFLDREFADGAVRVRSIGESADPQVRLSHYTHAHPALFREGGVVPPIWAYSTSKANCLLGVARVAQFQGLIAMPDRKIGSPDNLRGARIALPRRPGAPIDFSRAVTSQGIVSLLATAGLGEGDVTLVDVEFREPFLSLAAGTERASVYTARENVRLHTAEVLALVRGEVDAIYVSGPHGLSIAALIDAVPIPGLHEDGATAGWAGNHLRVLTTSRALVEERPDDVAQYIVGLLRASAWSAQHPDETWAAIAAEVGVAPEWAQAAYHPDTVRRLAPETTPEALAMLQARSDFLSERGFIPTSVDVTEWHDPRPLRAALALA